VHTITVAKIPSVNHYVKHAKGRHFKSKDVIGFEKAVNSQLSLDLPYCDYATCGPPDSDIFKSLRIIFTLCKDFYRRDLDNMPKCFLDCLSEFFRFNDSRIEKLVLEKKLDKTLDHEVISWSVCDDAADKKLALELADIARILASMPETQGYAVRIAAAVGKWTEAKGGSL